MITEAKEFLESKTSRRPRIAVVLGSGLGDFGSELSGTKEISYGEIPGWPVSTAVGHAGKLIFGRIKQTEVVLLSGRAHLYEGYSAQQAAFGVRVLAKFGVERFVLTNAAGGINEKYSRGALVLIKDHINLQGANPLTGPNDDTLGPRFPDMTEAYSLRMRQMAADVARTIGIDLPDGVYAALPGPSYETPAEIRYLRKIGADLVGMSTVPEAIALNHMGREVLGISCVTNMAAGMLPQKLHHDEVLEIGRSVAGTFTRLLCALLPKLER